ncbi:Gfo/Idh/MocA family oxidoreductase [Chelativorans sp. M5D2P16]|uniref:Gfo/Idh/MocA family protein n=1 Tax=Chelativorans sp. M5D2P16 TaxID=3095678 RepID=UPI002ACA84FB|nr:Gfo/Idh/MocA family oxidoreductase [Chelativorans sp. M5D2P16]MDZ5698566.1 Gfo/Idh/MocA family oxidoreductase [Chelativorans sp. M5D2P16]
MSTIRYGLVGAGMMGQEHIRNIALLEGAEVVAIADPDDAMRRKAADLAGPSVRTFTDHRDMLSAGLCDVYVVAAPNDLHLSLMRGLMATDKPILCEKPLATTTRDCLELMRLAEGRAAPVWVAMEYRYMAPITRLIEEVRRGRAGAPRMVSIREHRFPFLTKVGGWNRFNARTGGTLVEKCCHLFDLMRHIFDSEPVRLFATGGADVNHRDERYDGRVPDILDNAYVCVDFEAGQRGMLDLCMFAEGARWQEEVMVAGDVARLQALVPGPARFSRDGKERAAEFVVADRREKEELHETVTVEEKILRAGDHYGATFFQHQRFLELTRRGAGKPEVGISEGYWSVLIGEAAERSVQTGQPVDLRQFAREAAR